MKLAFHTLAIAILCALSVTADAQSFPPPGLNPYLCSPQNPGACLNGVSSSVTALDALRVTLPGTQDRQDEDQRKKKRAAFGRLDIAANDGISGLLAGDGSGLAIWAGYGHAQFEGSVPVAPYDAKTNTYRLGLDKRIGQNFVLGVAVLADRLKTHTIFNGGGQDADTNTLAPYLSYMFSDSVSFDVNGGYGWLSASQRRIDPATGGTLSSTFDGHRYFWSATLNLFRPIGDWNVGGRLGFIDSRDRQDAYTEVGGPSARNVRERNLKLSQLFGGVDVSYRFAGNAEVYGSSIYRYDTSRKDGSDAGGLPNAVGSTQPNDRSEFEWTLGMRIYPSRSVTLGAEFVKTTNRDQFSHHAFNLLARFDF